VSIALIARGRANEHLKRASARVSTIVGRPRRSDHPRRHNSQLGEAPIPAADILARDFGAEDRKDLRSRETTLWVVADDGRLVGDQAAVNSADGITGQLHLPGAGFRFRCVRRKFREIEFNPRTLPDWPGDLFSLIRLTSGQRLTLQRGGSMRDVYRRAFGYGDNTLAPELSPTMTYGTGVGGDKAAEAHVTGTVDGVAKVELTINAGSSLIDVVKQAQAAVRLSGTINSSGPGSLGHSSPDASAPSPQPSTGQSGGASGGN
jgi:hypothetical protein